MRKQDQILQTVRNGGTHALSRCPIASAKGASLQDPSGLFNASLEGNPRRAIDFHEGDKIDEKVLKALIRAAA